jgi:hypothetical protein
MTRDQLIDELLRVGWSASVRVKCRQINLNHSFDRAVKISSNEHHGKLI